MENTNLTKKRNSIENEFLMLLKKQIIDVCGTKRRKVKESSSPTPLTNMDILWETNEGIDKK